MEDAMRHRFFNRGFKIVSMIAGLLLLGSVTMFSGQGAGSSPVAAMATTQDISHPAGFPEVAKAVRPAVVNITPSQKLVRGREHDPRLPFDWPDEFFNFPRRPFGPMPRGPEHRGMGMGSGVIVSSDGYIITNNHVVDGAAEVQVTLPDKREFKGKIVGTDPRTDLAVIKVDARDLPYVPWGDSSKLQVGEYVLAVGNPFGLNSTVTLGIVSALGRGRMGITQYEDFIQTDAAINPGNSGGALVNTRGELVGINTAIFSQTGGYQGVGFAVPSSMAKPVSESLIKTGKVVRGYLGVGIQDLTPELAKSFGLKDRKGVLVSDVADGSPAEHGGLKQGDVIIEYQGSAMEDPAALQRAVTGTPVGTKAKVKVLRDGQAKELTIVVGEQPETRKLARAGQDSSADHALAGIEVQPLDRQTARELGLSEKTKGVVVTAVEPDSTADRAGLTEGDVIQEVNRQPIRSLADFERVTTQLKKDHPVLMLINRRGASLFITVKV
jgi:serine protease Do